MHTSLRARNTSVRWPNFTNESFVCGARLAAGHRKYVLRSFGGLVPTKKWINSQERIAAEKAGKPLSFVPRETNFDEENHNFVLNGPENHPC